MRFPPPILPLIEFLDRNRRLFSALSSSRNSHLISSNPKVPLQVWRPGWLWSLTDVVKHDGKWRRQLRTEMRTKACQCARRLETYRGDYLSPLAFFCGVKRGRRFDRRQFQQAAS